MTNFIFGKTAKGLPIPAFRFNKGPHRVLILGGVHGDEYEGVAAAWGLYKEFLDHPIQNIDLTLVPMFNLEGILSKSRTNSNGVDLNRNLPTKDWSANVKGPRYHPGPSPNSEPENQALAEFINSQNPVFVLSLHSWEPVLNVNGDCLEQAKIISEHTGYRIDTDIGYPTPGCLGTYAGLERNSPTLTYEIERGLAVDKIQEAHVPAILKSLKWMETNYGKNN